MNNLVIFDFDFTIAKTTEHIWVWSPRGNYQYQNKTYRRVHPTELQQNNISNDEVIDDNSYIEFYDLDISRTQLIKPIIPYLHFYSQNELYILTARPQIIENMVINFLQNNSITTTYIKFIGLTNSCMTKKISWISQTMQDSNYDHLILFEDNKRLIDYYMNNHTNISKHLYYIQNYQSKITLTFYE